MEVSKGTFPVSKGYYNDHNPIIHYEYRNITCTTAVTAVGVSRARERPYLSLQVGFKYRDVFLLVWLPYQGSRIYALLSKLYYL